MQMESPGPGRLAELSADECWELASSRPVGRLAWSGQRGPVVIPVNFSLDGHSVHVRTTAYSEAAQECDDSPVAFEVDSFDQTEHTGWSVLMRGQAHLDFGAPPGAHEPEVWVSGSRHLRLRVEVEEITGRRIRGAD
jgi:nitroimidazol reductase NimA-like FMN-containing flavoprotein (pyridoxamine 5'-phosphate oxidase superfamily)